MLWSPADLLPGSATWPKPHANQRTKPCNGNIISCLPSMYV